LVDEVIQTVSTSKGEEMKNEEKTDQREATTAAQEIEIARRTIAKCITANVVGCVNSPEGLLMYATMLEKIR